MTYDVRICNEKYVSGNNFEVEDWCEEFLGGDGTKNSHRWYVEYYEDEDIYQFKELEPAFLCWIIWA